MVNHEINYRQQTDDRAHYKGLDSGGLPDHVSVEPGHERESRNPEFAMAKAKFLADRARHFRVQGERIGEPICEVNEPRGEEKGDSVPDLKRNAEATGEKPQPRHRNQGGIEADQIE